MSGWPMVRLGDVAKLVERPEVPVSGKEYRQIGVRLWGEGAYEREPTDGGATRYKTLSRVEAGDIIVNKIWARNGSVSVVPQRLAGAYVSGEFPTFIAAHDRLDPRWFFWLTKTRQFWEQCDAKSRGTSGKNRIRPEKFLEIELRLPPLGEQLRIVAWLDEVAARVGEAGRLRQEAAGQTTQLLVVMAHRPDLSEADKERAGWRRVRLGEVMVQVQDLHRVDTIAQYPNLGIYSFGRGLFHKPPIDGVSTSADVLNRVHVGHFIYSRLFAFEGAYGTVSQEFDGCFVSMEYPTFKCNEGLATPAFIGAYFQAPHIWHEVATGSKGLGHRRQRVQPPQPLAHRLWVPPLREQDRIGKAALAAKEVEGLQVAAAERMGSVMAAACRAFFVSGAVWGLTVPV